MFKDVEIAQFKKIGIYRDPRARGLSKKYPTFGHKTYNAINITNLIKFSSKHTFPSASAIFGSIS